MTSRKMADEAPEENPGEGELPWWVSIGLLCSIVAEVAGVPGDASTVITVLALCGVAVTCAFGVLMLYCDHLLSKDWPVSRKETRT